MIHTRAFHPSDIDRIILRDGQELAAAAPDRVKLNAEYGEGWTMEDARTGEIIGCGGYVAFTPGVGEMWLVCGAGFDRYAKSIVKMARMFIAGCDGKFHRLHMAVRADCARNLRFAQVLGFHEEATLRQFDESKNDYIMMARIR